VVTGQLEDTPTRGLDKSRTEQLADAAGDFVCFVFDFGHLIMVALCNRADHYIFILFLLLSFFFFFLA